MVCRLSLKYNFVLFTKNCFVSWCFGFNRFCPKGLSCISLFCSLTLQVFIQATNAEIEGGTLLLVVLLILAFSSSSSFYHAFKKNDKTRIKTIGGQYFSFFFFVGLFYTTSGLNKLIDVGPWWPFTLHLERLAQVSLENSLFLYSRRVDAFLLYCIECRILLVLRCRHNNFILRVVVYFNSLLSQIPPFPCYKYVYFYTT